MRSHRLFSGLLATSFVLLLLVACGSAASGPVAQPVGARLSGAGAPAAAATAAPAEGGSDTAQNGSNAAPVDAAYIVREGSLDVEVADLQATLNQAQGLVTGFGGYISGSKESHDDNDAAFAAVTYRFPVQHWDEALAKLRALGTKVLSENTDAKDVTADVVDMDARLANLRSAETQYQQIMLQAKTISDVLKVQDELNKTRGEIEQLQAQRDNLANRAALATLTVNWQVPTTATATVNEGWDPGVEVDRALASLVSFGQGLATLLIWLAIAILPIAIPLGVLAFIAYRILRPRLQRVTIEETPTAEA